MNQTAENQYVKLTLNIGKYGALNGRLISSSG